MGEVVAANLRAGIRRRAVLVCEHNDRRLVSAPHALTLQEPGDIPQPFIHAVHHTSKCPTLLVPTHDAIRQTSIYIHRRCQACILLTQPRSTYRILVVNDDNCA